MPTSLFGDLIESARRPPRPAADDDAGFPPTAVLETGASRPDRAMPPAAPQDLLVDGSPAQAIRAHFTSTCDDLGATAALLTIVDPAGRGAAAVIRALSDATGQPIERLHLRDRASLRPLATIERTTLRRRQGDPLAVVHAEVRAPGSENAGIALALMERSHLAVVIVGALEPAAVEALAGALHEATMLPSWHCPNLLFLLPRDDAAAGSARRVAAPPWPARLRVETVEVGGRGASSAWNAMLGVWNRLNDGPHWEAPAIESAFGELAFDDPWVGQASAARDAAEAARPAPPPPAERPGTAGLRAALGGLLALEGVACAALVEIASGAVLACETAAPDRPGGASAAASTEGARRAVEKAAAGAAALLRAHRRSGTGPGDHEPLSELLLSLGARRRMIRPLPRRPDLCLVVDFDRRSVEPARVRSRAVAIMRADEVDAVGDASRVDAQRGAARPRPTPLFASASARSLPGSPE